MARTFTDETTATVAEVQSAEEPTVPTEQAEAVVPDNAAPAETAAPEKLTPAQARKAAEEVWNAAVSNMLDNGVEADPVVIAAALGRCQNGSRILREFFGQSTEPLITDPEGFPKASRIATLKNAVDSVLSAVPDKAGSGSSGPSPEQVRASLVQRFARAAWVRAALEYALAAYNIEAPESLTADEQAVIDGIGETIPQNLKDALDAAGKVLRGEGRKSPATTGESGGSQAHKSEASDYVPGARFVHKDKSGKVTATLVINADGSQTMTRDNGSVNQYPKGTSPSKSATDEAGNSNRNGLIHWALDA